MLVYIQWALSKYLFVFWFSTQIHKLSSVYQFRVHFNSLQSKICCVLPCNHNNECQNIKPCVCRKYVCFGHFINIDNPHAGVHAIRRQLWNLRIHISSPRSCYCWFCPFWFRWWRWTQPISGLENRSVIIKQWIILEHSWCITHWSISVSFLLQSLGLLSGCQNCNLIYAIQFI